MSWLSIPADSHFSIENIPFGIISHSGADAPRPAVAIGDFALDLAAFADGQGFKHLPDLQSKLGVFKEQTLNAFAALGKKAHSQTRRYLQDVLSANGRYPDILKDNKSLQSSALVPLKDCKTHLPMRIGDYTDFYAGLNHAYNVGVLFRGPDNALQPNYKHLPVGYHGRASTVVVSGTPIPRPNGQILANPAAATKTPVFSACKKLDIELELGAFLCGDTALGEPIPIANAADHIFGVVLMNDWSARDIQAWEYVPLGPFLAKSFGTTISPWIVLTEALEPFLAQGIEPGNRESLLPYLREKEAANCYDIGLKVDLKPAGGAAPETISRTSSRNLLFSFAQMVAHHSVNGCAMKTGDLLGSGTISGTDKSSLGSLLEQTDNGKNPITVGSASRTFLEDGDEVVIRGVCGEKGRLVGFGECRGRIVPGRTA